MLGRLLGSALALGAAAPGEPEITWQAPAGCSDAAAVRRRIEDLLRRPLAPGEVLVDGVVKAEGSEFVLHLRVQAGEVLDERSLRAGRCPSLADTAALVAAVMVDPAVADTVLVPEPDPVPEEPPTPEGEATGEGEAASTTGAGDERGGEATGEEQAVNEPGADAVREEETGRDDGAATETEAASLPGRGAAADALRTADPSRAPAGLWLRARAGGEIGAIPAGTGGVALGVAVGGPRLRGELEGQYWAGRRAESDRGAARIHLGSVVARVCGVVPRRPLAAVVCAGVELGAMRADALEPARLTRHRPWLAAQAELALRWQPRPRVALWIGAQPFVPIVFPRFELRDPAAPDAPETIHEPAPVGVRGLLGVELRAFPGGRDAAR